MKNTVRYVSPWVEETITVGRKMAFVAGPRQVGKTTAARRLLPSTAGYYNWDVESHRRSILAAPELFWHVGGASRTRVVLDEIHKYPRWKRFLKGLFDLHREELELVVTGSGRLDVYQKGGDSLLGRYELLRLHPFTVGEYLAHGEQQVPTPEELTARLIEAAPVPRAAEALDLIDRFGCFPEPLFAGRADKLRRWRRTRRQLVLREDIRDLTRIRELGLIDQMVGLLPERIGSPLSINSLREDLGVAFNTAQGWLDVLQRLYYLFEIRPFTARIARSLRREGKFYLFDPTEIADQGARYENLVALHLIKLVDAWNDRGEGDFSLHYVRDKERREVDFLVTERRKPWLLLEAKVGDTTVSPALRRFADVLRPAFAVQLVRTGEPLVSAGVRVLPADRVLSWM